MLFFYLRNSSVTHEQPVPTRMNLYVVYLIPREGTRLHRSLTEFFQRTEIECKNKVHDYFPHASVSSFLVALETFESKVIPVFTEKSKIFTSLEPTLGSFFCSKKFIGINLTSEKISEFLKAVLADLTSELNMRIPSNPMHISLAHGDVSQHIEMLRKICSEFGLDTPESFSDSSSWNLAIFCRKKDAPPEEWMRVPVWMIELQKN